MNKSDLTLEQLVAREFVSEFSTRGRMNDVLPILSLISELYDGPGMSEEPLVSQKHGAFVRKFVIDIIEPLGTTFSVGVFVSNAIEYYNTCISSIEIHLFTDTPYSEDLKEYIGTLCKKMCGAEVYTIYEKVTPTHGGGFIAKFRDYYLDASYRRGLVLN